jgi:hypothetical protein
MTYFFGSIVWILSRFNTPKDQSRTYFLSVVKNHKLNIIMDSDFSVKDIQLLSLNKKLPKVSSGYHPLKIGDWWRKVSNHKKILMFLSKSHMRHTFLTLTPSGNPDYCTKKSHSWFPDRISSRFSKNSVFVHEHF